MFLKTADGYINISAIVCVEYKSGAREAKVKYTYGQATQVTEAKGEDVERLLAGDPPAM